MRLNLKKCVNLTGLRLQRICLNNFLRQIEFKEISIITKMNHLNTFFNCACFNCATNIYLYSCIVLYFYISKVKVYLINNYIRISFFYI